MWVDFEAALPEALQVTGNHRIFSVTRQDWASAKATYTA
jgi:hypothetical protein